MEEKIPVLVENLEIPSYLADLKAQLRLDSLFMLLQEMSDRHASILGAGWHDLRKSGFFWVITKMSLKINRIPEWTEKVQMRSWVRPSDAATSPREYEISDPAGNVLISGSSVWAILDIEQSRPQRMSLFDGCFLPQEMESSAGKPRKIKPVKLPETKTEGKPVEISDIDMNLHVNNAHYIQWAINSLSESYYKTHSVEELVVNFISQAKLGDRYSVYSEQITDDEFITSIFSADDKKEFCRISSKWRTEK